MGNEKIKLAAILGKDIVYISSNLKGIAGDSYYSIYPNQSCKDYYYDGIKPIATYDNGWFSIASFPDKVEIKKPGQHINKRLVLKAGFPVSELTPAVINSSYIDEDDPYYEIRGLYEYKYDQEEEQMQELDVEWEIIDKLPNFTAIQPKPGVIHNLVDKITTPSILLSTKPCSISGPELYKIIRNHVKTYIDGRVARITSDYDFSFTVTKNIRLLEPKFYQKEHKVGRKTKYTTEYQTDKSYKIVDISTDGKYGTKVEPLSADNYEDLNKKISDMLDDLMVQINTPLEECPCCKGTSLKHNINETSK